MFSQADINTVATCATSPTDSDRKMRVLLYELPQLLTGIVMDILRTQEDIEVSTSDGDDLVGRARAYEPDVIIRYADSWTPSAEDDDLLRSLADLRILVLSNRGKKTWLYENRPVKTGIGEISPDMLLAAVRGKPDAPDRSI